MLTKFLRTFVVVFLFLIGGLLLAGCQPNQGKEHPIFSLVRNNDAARVGQYLAEAGDPNLKNEDGDSLLYVASGAKGGVEVVALLLLGGADPNMISREGRTALHTAAAWCNTESVEKLLNANARSDIKNAEGKIAIEVVCSQPLERRDPVLALLRAASN